MLAATKKRVSKKFEAILFDCDGVLVDSEPIANGVLRDLLEEGGWPLLPRECMQILIGKASASWLFAALSELPALLDGK